MWFTRSLVKVSRVSSVVSRKIAKAITPGMRKSENSAPSPYTGSELSIWRGLSIPISSIVTLMASCSWRKRAE